MQYPSKNTIVFFFLLLTTPLIGLAQVELCDNGIDDDGDGLIDLNDEDCFCKIIYPFSLIPNPSFEDTICCPDKISQLGCATGWIQASVPTTDFIHNCGWGGPVDFPPPFPFPDGEGAMGFRDGRVRNNGTQVEALWKEYAGACLLTPMLADTLYRFQFELGFIDSIKSPPINISVFGTRSCNYLPFGIGDEEFGCPANDPNWFQLGEVAVSGDSGNVWVQSFIDIQPTQDIQAIAIGPECDPLGHTVNTYYYFDNLVLADIEAFDFLLTEIFHPCNPDFALSVPFDSAYSYQWYLDGLALVGESFSMLTQNYGEGAYQVRILDDTICRITAPYDYVIPVFDEPEVVSICEGESYLFGTRELTRTGFYQDSFITQNNCDSIASVDLTVISQQVDTVSVAIVQGDSYQFANQSFTETGDYPLKLTSSLGCDSLVLLQLRYFEVYIPNAFSPNFDGVNDVFRPFANGDKIQSIRMTIFDRWGNQLYQGTEWNGSAAPVGVYLYLMEVAFDYGATKTYYGDLLLYK